MQTKVRTKSYIGANTNHGGQISLPKNGLFTIKNLKADGSIIAGTNVKINLTGDLDNEGTIQGGNATQIEAANINNLGGSLGGNGLTELKAREDIVNLNGTINGKDIEIHAGCDFKSETLAANQQPFDLPTVSAMNSAGINASGDLAVHTGRDISLTGAQINAGRDIHLTTDHALRIVSAVKAEDEKIHSIITNSIKNSSTHLKAGGSIVLSSGDDMTLLGAQLAAGKAIEISAETIQIINSVDTYASYTKDEPEQSSPIFFLGHGPVNAALVNIAKACQAQDDRLKDLYTYKAYKDLNAFENLKKTSKATGVHISLGNSSPTCEQNICLETSNLSNISAAASVNITAKRDDIALTGAAISATKVTLTAARGINVSAAQNKRQITNSSSISSWATGSNIGFRKNSRQENNNIITNTGSLISADGEVIVTAGHDLHIIGSKINSGKIVAQVGHDLHIVSLQDVDKYNADSANISIDQAISTYDNKPFSLASSNHGKTNSNHTSVVNQAGIFAGNGGLTIFVGGNTQLQGAAIGSDALNCINRLSTDTLSFSDINNLANYSANGFGITYASQAGEKGSEIEKGFTPNLIPTVNGDANSTTKPAISVGTDHIEVRSTPDIDLSGIRIDPKEALNTLAKIFDKKTVQEKQELASIFGEMGYAAVGELARSHQKEAYDKLYEAVCANNSETKARLIQEAKDILSYWGQGGTNKIALHGLVGGIMSDLSGNSFTAGAISAGRNEALQKKLGEWEEQNRAANQWVSLAMGAALDKAAGGSSNIGAVAALSGTKYNWDHYGHNLIIDHLNFPPYDAEKLKDADTYWDTHAPLFEKGHAMPNHNDGAEYWRSQIRDFCAKCLFYAINAKLNGETLEAINQLAIALHVVGDDYSHRQVDADLMAHIPRDDVPPGTGTFGSQTPNVDNCRTHPEQFNRAIEAAKCVLKQYEDGGGSTTTDQLQNAIDWCFPIIERQDQPIPPSNIYPW